MMTIQHRRYVYDDIASTGAAHQDHLMTHDTQGIRGKVIGITGASSGIGEAAARRLAAAGARVVLGARRTDRLDAIVRTLRSAGHEVESRSLDVTQRADVQGFIDRALELHGRLDVLINNAGIMPLSLLEQLEVERWEQMIDVNLKGVLYGIAAALPVMKRQRSGHIINVSSIAGFRVVPTAAVYSATKFAVHALSEGLRQEVGAMIRVTVVSPGATESELADAISDESLRTRVVQEYRQKVIPADAIARAIAFAISQPDDVDVNELVVRPTAQAY
jgi:NADP-dependent 3-hydroxy acid dehydrogenase YdfG